MGRERQGRPQEGALDRMPKDPRLLFPARPPPVKQIWGACLQTRTHFSGGILRKACLLGSLSEMSPPAGRQRSPRSRRGGAELQLSARTAGGGHVVAALAPSFLPTLQLAGPGGSVAALGALR